MDNANNLTVNVPINEQLKKSKTLYFATGFGFLTLFFLILCPFLPIGGSYSVLQSIINASNGIYGYDNYDPATDVLALISVLLFFFIYGILCVTKLKKNGGMVAYNFHKMFYNVASVFVLISLAQLLWDFSAFNFTTQYFAYIAIAAVLMMPVMQIAQIANKPLRITIGKTIHAVACVVFGWILLAVLLVVSELVSGSGIYYQSTEYYIFQLLQFIIIMFLAHQGHHIAMPVNEPFMYAKVGGIRNTKNRTSPIGIVNKVLTLIAFVILAIVSIGTKVYLAIIPSVLGSFFCVVLIVWAKIVNKKLVAVQEFKGFFANQQAGDTVAATSTEEQVDNGKYLWQVGALKNRNDAVKSVDKLTINEFAAALTEKINQRGIEISNFDVNNLVAAFASSKIIFIKCANKRLIKDFSQVLSDSLDTELFAENYYDETEGQEHKFDATTGQPLPPVLNENNVRLNKKYGVASGIFVSNYLSNLMNTIFLDYSGKEFSEYTSDLFTMVANGAETVYVGKHDYLPACDVYRSSNVTLPSNLWLIAFIDSSNILSTINPDYIQYTSLIEINIADKVATEENKNVVPLTFEAFSHAVEESQDDFYLNESYWKKIDKLEEFLLKKAGVRFDNRFIRQIEQAAGAIVALGGTQQEALDTMLTMRVLPLIATERDKIIDQEGGDFQLFLDELIGLENIPMTKNALAELGLKN